MVGGSVDVRGALLETTGIAALIFGLSSGQQHGFTAPATIIALALAVLLTTGFVFAEKRSAAPMLPCRSWRSRPGGPRSRRCC
jgi:hypothetical protein